MLKRRQLPEIIYQAAARQDLPRYPSGKAAQSLRQEESRWRKIKASRLPVVKGILPAEVSVKMSPQLAATVETMLPNLFHSLQSRHVPP